MTNDTFEEKCHVDNALEIKCSIRTVCSSCLRATYAFEVAHLGSVFHSWSPQVGDSSPLLSAALSVVFLSPLFVLLGMIV